MKIVSLCPSLTELVFDLGVGQELVGITDYCVHPADEVSRVETVGGTKTPDTVRIIELQPDLVLMNEEENRREDAEELEEAGLKILNTFPKTCSETAAMVEQIAAAVGRPVEGGEIARDIERRRARVCEEARGRSPVRWAYLIWRRPWMTVNADTFISHLLDQAGGLNVFGDREVRYPEFTLEDLVAAKPDLVLLGSEPFAFGAEHMAEIAGLTGISSSQMRLADGEYLSWHGSRTPAGIDYAASLIAAATQVRR